MTSQKLETKKVSKKFRNARKSKKSKTSSTPRKLKDEEIAFLENLRKPKGSEAKTKVGRITLNELFGTELPMTNNASLNAFGNPFYLDPIQILQMQILLNQKSQMHGFCYNTGMFLPEMPLPTTRLTPAGVGMLDPEYDSKNSKNVYNQKNNSLGNSGYEGESHNDIMNRFFPKLNQEHFKCSDMKLDCFSPYHNKMSRGSHATRGNYNHNSHHQKNSQFKHGQQASNSNTFVRSAGNKNVPKKSFFVPYITQDQVARGLKNNQLVSGIIRVNQKNYEESYIDNPEGDDQVDVLILGLHDRNRALHGDIVVVKYKDRMNWVVRENLYQSWREGKLGNVLDDDGQPISIPPVTESNLPKSEMDDLLDFMPTAFRSRIEKIEEDKMNVDFSKDSYSRVELLNIAAKMQLELRRKSSDDKVLCHLCGDACNSVRKLQLSRVQHNDDEECDCPDSPNQRKFTATGSRRVVFRTLNDMPAEDWGIPDICLQKTAEVVYIKEERHTRMAVGQLKPLSDGNKNYALFSPADPRMPRMMIPSDQLPDKFYEAPGDFTKFIFVAKLIEWNERSQFARGKLYRPIGLSTEVDSQIKGILMSNGVEFKDFTPNSMSSLKYLTADEFVITPKDLEVRRDYRSEMTISIDPKNSRDIDDLIHIKSLENIDGNGSKGYEVGVHIADVTHFLESKSELDEWAQRRGESLYMTSKTIPMLPEILSEELCGLLKGRDRFAISVVWKITEDGNVIDEWIGKTIVNSKAQLSYDDVNNLFENSEEVLNEEALSMKDNLLTFKNLYSVLNKKRREAGYLYLPKPKIVFTLAENTSVPVSISMEKGGVAKEIVAEFMTMANCSVARRLEAEYPKLAILRRQAKPKQKILQDTIDFCSKLGYDIDASSSKSIADFLNSLLNDPVSRNTVYPVLTQLLSKPMQMAQYVCAGLTMNEEECKHYALNTNLYTHFTAPIRRYADIMAHRLLSASLGHSKISDLAPKHMEIICKNSNEKRLSARTCMEACDELYLGYVIKEFGKLEQVGVVVGILDQAFEVYFPKLGISKRVYTNRLRLLREPIYECAPLPQLTLIWDPVLLENPVGNDGDKPLEVEDVSTKGGTYEQVVKVCSLVRCVFSPTSEAFKYQTVILPTNDSDIPAMIDELNSDSLL
ncbi:DIS3-like exonuclease 2 [Strongyloides ratti]|uniref:DIS3-like exonuclease 2 n=1 Tax=Strongyloides ratti TaxID=34506 RepID=A0A090MSE6_STRRB|nr:DIS3-like exonuclease 2 [Strongyloides ratti]CEF61173.1 DIS3-like exonuclease 2 [Strongyloides ratti]